MYQNNGGIYRFFFAINRCVLYLVGFIGAQEWSSLFYFFAQQVEAMEYRYLCFGLYW